MYKSSILNGNIFSKEELWIKKKLFKWYKNDSKKNLNYFYSLLLLLDSIEPMGQLMMEGRKRTSKI